MYFFVSKNIYSNPVRKYYTAVQIEYAVDFAAFEKILKKLSKNHLQKIKICVIIIITIIVTDY